MTENSGLLARIQTLYRRLREQMKADHRRHVSFADLITDREERAREYGFGEGATCYDNVLVLGDVTVGRHTWIGPNVVLDGSGGLEIGDYCSISAGVQIYSHDTVVWSTSLGQEPITKGKTPTVIGNGVYIGPQTVIEKEISIGDGAVIGANSLVNSSVPAGMKAFGTPARVIGPVEGREAE